MITLDQINLAHIKVEVEAAFEAYETALMKNDLTMLDQFFWPSYLTTRFGLAENLYGIEAIRAFREARDTGTLKRTLINSRITTYGEDFATATTEFVRDDQSVGRQSQAWVRFLGGWRIVSAHISMNEECSSSSSESSNRNA